MLSSVIFIFAVAISHALGQACDVMEVSTKSPTAMLLQSRTIGVYRRQTGVTCHGHPTFKHVINQRYLYVSDGDIWVIGNQQNHDNCRNSGFYYRIARPLPSLPDSSNWFYHNWVNNLWYRDTRMCVQCQCNVIKMTSQLVSQATLTLDQASMSGVYLKSKHLSCNKRPVYINTVNDKYLFYTSANQWTVSDGNQARTCAGSVGDPYNAAAHAHSNFPATSGWMYLDPRIERYVEYADMQSQCVTTDRGEKRLDEVEVGNEIDVGAADGSYDIVGGLETSLLDTTK